MTKLELAFEKVRGLPPAEQEFVADWLLGVGQADGYRLSDEEVAEVEKRLATNEASVPAEAVFAKFGL